MQKEGTSITNSYSANGSGPFGLVGSSQSGIVNSSYWDTDRANSTTSSNGGYGETSAAMKMQATFVGWDFNTVWGISPTKNGGYPYLQWRFPLVKWNGTAWQPNMPSATDDAAIHGNYDVAVNGNIEAKELSIAEGVTLTMPSGTMTVNSHFTNSGTFTQTGGTFSMNGTAAQLISGTNTFHNLAINNAAGVTLSGLNKVTGVLTLTNGTLATGGSLTLASNANGTGHIIGDLSKISGEVTVERYIRNNSALITGATANKGTFMMGVPVSGATVASLQGITLNLTNAAAYNTNYTAVTGASAPNFVMYDETRITANTGVAGKFDKGWYAPTATSVALTPGRGMSVRTAVGNTASFKGTLNTGNVAVTLTRGAFTNSGWQQLGNPYAAPLSLDAFIEDADNVNKIGATAQFWVASGEFTGFWRTYVATTGVSSNAAVANNTGVIAPMQGFMVRNRTNTTNVPVTFKESHLRDASFTSFRKNLQGIARLEVSANGVADEFVVLGNEDATLGSSDALDGARPSLNAGYPTIWEEAADMLQVSAVPAGAEHYRFPIGLEAVASGLHTFRLGEYKDMPQGAWLEDRASSMVYDLKAGACRLDLNAGMHTGRFVLHLGKKPELQSTPEGFTVYASGATVYVSIPNDAGEAVMFDVSGREVFRTAVEKQGSFQAALPKGVYLVRVSSEGGTVAKKVMIE
jgi:hypothetical protein